LGFAAAASFSRALRVNERQAATMSPEAVEMLKSLKMLRVPFITPSNEMILYLRSSLAKIQSAQLQEAKARFNPGIEDTAIDGVRVALITPKKLAQEYEKKVLLFIHGGGYIMGSPTDNTAILMASEMGIRTYSVDYQLAPEARFPVALNECLKVYAHLVASYGADSVLASGASSGAGHLLATLLKARESRLPMIRAIAVFSPSVDLTPRGDSITSNEGRDVLAYDNQTDKFYAAPFLGGASPEDPFVSPIYGTYDSAFPATVAVTGTRDAVLSGAVRLYWKLKDARVPAELSVSEGMWHGFFTSPDIPEAARARRAAQEFLLAHSSHSDRGATQPKQQTPPARDWVPAAS
jgi:epsilon-lactone hydrolase